MRQPPARRKGENMGVLSNLEPGSVFRFFEEITKIPHGSVNVEQISDYLAEFARERKLFLIQDERKNIIMVKEASPGYECEKPVILQGHMDMVAVKTGDCPIDLKTEGLQAAVDGDKVYAKGTSLGGDDGIAVAYCLALLDSDTIRHPRLEVVLTTDEETGMDGARAIDLSMLTGNRMINLDSEEEGIFLTSCAGGARVKCSLDLGALHPIEWSGEDEGNPRKEMCVYEVMVGGLDGGHSGGEIHKERGNSNCLFGRLLNRLCDRIPVGLIQVHGGLADNAIPRETVGVLAAAPEDGEAFLEILSTVEKEVRTELSSKDPGVYITARRLEQGSFLCTGGEAARRAARFLCALPNGVQAMSADVPGLVETSLNLGILEFTGEDEALFTAEFSVRSSLESAKAALIERLRAVTELAGGTNTVTGDYPGWRFRKDSPLREKMVELYREMYGRKPQVEAIHAGLECGILGSKIPDLDCVSIGPDMQNIHTTEETLSISSVKRVWEYLVRLLETKDA